MSSRPNPDPPLKGAPTVVLEAGLASYEFVRPLGQGHHGELLLTRQRYQGGVGGLTVLKRLNRVVRQEDYQRLVEEARLGGQLRHPNIVSVQMLGGDAAEPLLLMEYIEGQPLGDVMRRAERSGRGFSEALACHVTAEVADALHYAHALHDEKGRHLGIVHRDVTPQGILVGRWGEVKLMDFGAAWSRLEGRISTEGDTDLGNVAYSSPERAQLEQLDGRSDLFSLGLVFLQLLTGRHLLDAAARHEAELLGRQLRVRGDSGRPELEELSAVRTAELLKRMRELTSEQVEEGLGEAPEPLRPILRKLLAPRREDRYATGAELAEALREHLWLTRQRYGHAALVSEVATLTESVLEDLEEPADPSRRGRGGKGRRGGPSKGA
ncbi:serine/threonine-protein kinase [Melittangium boletus]|uniref:Putative serine/threonine protein kinase n=1 Tax=Melittangium boletus DSM 14713 TaxID=1294270 RepID=A0A250ILM3_9BACT|nr:serine/threonine-protein kinase [Melittangium boletus]ATB32655.1 putative serine/threonine protein kinase [Melittangium boletus DSM 14713]